MQKRLLKVIITDGSKILFDKIKYVMDIVSKNVQTVYYMKKCTLYQLTLRGLC